MEGAPGLVAGGEVVRRGGMEMRGRPASSGTPAARGGLPLLAPWRRRHATRGGELVGCHEGGGVQHHGRAYGERGKSEGERRDSAEDMGTSPTLYLVVARGIKPRYYYQLSSSEG